jgi:hypothetical protein
MPITKATQNVLVPIVPQNQGIYPYLNITSTATLLSYNGTLVNNHPSWSGTGGGFSWTVSVASDQVSYDIFRNGVLIGNTLLSNGPGLLNINPSLGSIRTSFYIGDPTGPDDIFFQLATGANIAVSSDTTNFYQYTGKSFKFALEDHEHPYAFGSYRIISLLKSPNPTNFSFTDSFQTPAFYIHHTNNTTGSQYVIFQNNGNIVGQITRSATGVAYGTSSDYRLKENVVSIENGIDKLNLINPVEFNFKNDDSKTKVSGFIAHELATIIPEAVIGEKDAIEIVDEEGENGEVVKTEKIIPQMVDYSAVVPLLVKAVQELSAEVASLKAQLNL